MSWQWNNSEVWTNFDHEASKQIDAQLRNQWTHTNSTVVTFPITKGAWFSQKQNRGQYFCNAVLNHSRTHIHSINQQNMGTGFARQMRRVPDFVLHPHQQAQSQQPAQSQSNPVLQTAHNAFQFVTQNVFGQPQPPPHPQSAAKTHSHAHGHGHAHTHAHANGHGHGRPHHFPPQPQPQPQPHSFPMSYSPPQSQGGDAVWSWLDADGYKPYDNDTQKALESAFQAGQQSLLLQVGRFGGHRKGRYMVQFNRAVQPTTFAQLNVQTQFARTVCRTGGVDAGVVSHAGVGDDGEDKYGKWRKFFRPMSTRHFKTLKESEKLCSICFCEFEAKELFANQTAADAPPPPPPPQPQATTDTQTTDTNNHNGHNNHNHNNGSMDDDGDSEMLQSAPLSQSTEDHKENAPSKTHTDTDELKQTDMSEAMQQLIGDETIIHLSHCANDDHYFHTECIARWLNEKGKCCHCQKRYAVETGNQPLDGQLSAQYMNEACAGFHNYGTIRVRFQFNGGMQGPEHYHPGAPYPSECREVFFPDNMAGREALELTKMAWQRRLIFSVGKSLTTQRENVIVWESIHFKTRMSGGQQRHGYPDETYFDRFKEELKAKGLTAEDLDENAKHRIQHATGHQNYMYM